MAVELAYREADGVAVALLWDKASGELRVSVVDAREDDAFEIEILATEALDAFHHPYAYAAFRGAARNEPTLLAA